MTCISKNIETAATLLENDQVIAIPIETGYGLAGNALNPTVVRKNYEIENRPLSNPLIIHLPDATQLNKYVKDIPSMAEKLAGQFWLGPLTLLLPKNDVIPDIVTSGLPNVAVRIPSHPVTIQLLRKLSFPLAAPSANPFGYIRPTSAKDVKRILFGKIDCVLDGGLCVKRIESTIVSFDGYVPIIYRVGAISAEAIKKVAGKVEIKNKHTQKPISPGMLPSHYSPHTPLYLTNSIESILTTMPGTGTGILAFKNTSPAIDEINQEVLSASRNLDEAAHNLYKALYRLDSLKLDRIITELVPYTGIGIALMTGCKEQQIKSSMKIQYCSDMHLEFRENKKFFPKNPIQPTAEILVLAGDIIPFHLLNQQAVLFDFVSDKFETVYWLPGNHEYYHSDLGDIKNPLYEKIRENYFLVNNQIIQCKDVNLIFTTLWSTINPQNESNIQQSVADFSVIKIQGKRFTPAHFNGLHQNALPFFKTAFNTNGSKTNVVVSHHVPTLLNYPEQYKSSNINEAFAVELYGFIFNLNAAYWIFGHHHHNIPEFKIGNTIMLTNKLGYVQQQEQRGFITNSIINIK